MQVPFEEEICKPVIRNECETVTVEKCENVEQNVRTLFMPTLHLFKYLIKQWIKMCHIPT